MPSLDAKIEKQQRRWDLPLRQDDLAQRAGALALKGFVDVGSVDLAVSERTLYLSLGEETLTGVVTERRIEG